MQTQQHVSVRVDDLAEVVNVTLKVVPPSMPVLVPASRLMTGEPTQCYGRPALRRGSSVLSVHPEAWHVFSGNCSNSHLSSFLSFGVATAGNPRPAGLGGGGSEIDSTGRRSLRRSGDLDAHRRAAGGAVFSGTWASPNRTDPLLGAVSANGRDIYMGDDSGSLHGELRGPDEMEICRGQAVPTRCSRSVGSLRDVAEGVWPDRRPVSRAASRADNFVAFDDKKQVGVVKADTGPRRPGRVDLVDICVSRTSLLVEGAQTLR